MHDDLKPRQELEAEVAELRRRLAELEGPASHPLDAVETLATFDNDTDAMQASDAWFREMFEHGQGLMCTHSLDGILIAINPAAAKSLGYDPSELIGRPMAEFLNPRARHLFPTYLKRIKTHGTDSGIFNVITKQGENRVWVYRNAVVAEPGQEPYVIGHSQDITELREAANAERKAAADYRALVEHAGYGIYRASVDGRFLMVNPALRRMLGYGFEEELLQLNVAKDVFVDPSDRDRLINLSETTNRIDESETTWKKKDGDHIVVRLSGRAVRDATGRLECFEMFVKDVSEQRMLEEQLRQAQKMELVGQLTGGMAHDFNNLLTVILANANLIEASLPEDEHDMREDLGELEGAARRGTAMIKRLLSFSRRVHISQQPIDIGQIAGDLMSTLGRLLPETMEIQLECDDDLPKVLADPGAVEQIIINLATNARDAMQTGGKLHIRIQRSTLDESHRAKRGWGDPGEYVHLCATDAGIGMDENVKKRIFEPFFTTKQAGQGTGLGMPMIYGLMKQHGGFVDVESELGKGTSVHIYFPATKERAHTAAPADEIARLKGGSETILLVEDEEPIRRAAKRVLERFGYTVLLAANGEEGLQTFRDRRKDVNLVISDVMMPRMNGQELLSAVRGDEPAICFLFMSGYAASDLQGSLSMDASVPYLPKPWTPGQLLHQVRVILDGPLSKAD